MEKPREEPSPPQPPREDVHVTAKPQASPLRCPYCHEVVPVEESDWLACRDCLARHHGACWREAGACGACRSVASLRPHVPHARAWIAVSILMAVFSSTAAFIVVRNLNRGGTTSDASLTRSEQEAASTRTAQNDPRLAASAACHRGRARMLERDRKGAIVELTKAIEIDPTYGLAWDYRGVCYCDEHDFVRALADHTRAIELEPKVARPWAHRGYAKLISGDLDGAIADTTQALALDPRYHVALADRGTARDRKGDKTGAIEDYERYLELRPDGPSAERLRGRLAVLKKP